MCVCVCVIFVCLYVKVRVMCVFVCAFQYLTMPTGGAVSAESGDGAMVPAVVVDVTAVPVAEASSSPKGSCVYVCI